MFGPRGWWLCVSLLSFTAFAGEPKPTPVEQKSQTVMFNTRSLKFHSPSCEWAQKCTRHCVQVPREQAVKRGGVPCKVCGGR